ncbi:SPFH domain-containing protein [Candidatus Woesearchaeota archaeon]|nr:SPFH domain-containing protein [Candidatus Woesearchaeota archaeon]
MLGISYFKAEPTEYARISVNGKTKKEGKGISKIIWQPYRTSIELVPLSAIEKPFAFNELSEDNQPMSLQGGLIYTVNDAQKVLEKFNFSVDARTKSYLTEDPVKLPDQITRLAHTKARNVVQNTKLERLLRMGDALAHELTGYMKSGSELEDIGVNVEMVYISYIKPTSEIAKAIEAPFRESLLKEADKAIYDRRANAVEQERAIKNNELQTEIMLEQRRKDLLEEKEKNVLKEAEFKAKAEQMSIQVYSSMPPELLVGLGLLKIGEKAQQIGNLTITPELIGSIMQSVKQRS